MKKAGHALSLALLGLFVLTGCSSSSGDNPDGGTQGDSKVTPPDGPTGKQVGEACDKDEDCVSATCFEKTCKKVCEKPADCQSGDECTSDDGERLFCNTPSYPEDTGDSCAVTGKCTSAGMKCSGGKDYATAYCTNECKTDVDCPVELFCREGRDGKRRCARRGFCGYCLYDEQCGAGNLCVKGHCTRPCTVGKTECPRYAECKEVDGEPVCVHLFGSCVGDKKLCSPCVTKNDCQDKALCLTYIFSQESFCSQECGGGCPSSYECAEIPVTITEKTKQCVPSVPQGSKVLPKCIKQELKPLAEEGDKMPDFAMVGYEDEDGDGSLKGEKLKVINLSDYKNKAKIILFNVSAGWCGPCQTETKTFKSLMQKFGAQGLQIFQVLFDSDKQGERPTVTLLDAWVDVLGAQGAAGIDPARNSVVFNTGGTTPLNMILDARTRTVLEKFNGYNQADVEAKISKHLNP